MAIVSPVRARDAVVADLVELISLLDLRRRVRRSDCGSRSAPRGRARTTGGHDGAVLSKCADSRGSLERSERTPNGRGAGTGGTANGSCSHWSDPWMMRSWHEERRGGRKRGHPCTERAPLGASIRPGGSGRRPRRLSRPERSDDSSDVVLQCGRALHLNFTRTLHSCFASAPGPARIPGRDASGGHHRPAPRRSIPAARTFTRAPSGWMISAPGSSGGRPIANVSGGGMMQQRRMGRTGLKVSEICLGTMTFAGQCDEATSFRILDAAAERGVTFLDTADAYPIPPDIATAGRTEEVIGRWLSRAGGRRQSARAGDQVPDPGRARAQRPGALAPAHPGRLRGQPPPARGPITSTSISPISPDPETPIDETLRAFDDLVRVGQGPLRRLLELPGLAARTGAGDERAAGLGAVRLRPAALQPALPRDRGRALAALPRPGGRRDRVQPAGRRASLTGKHAGRRTAGAGDAVHPGRLGRALPRAVLARRAVRGRRRP